ncbi:modular serine protease [Halyomorpha halys]|uniref:modular serine protease n=1 Tax=Halyomorpha halys TaxID=286706 RepID=UPI0034D1B837
MKLYIIFLHLSSVFYASGGKRRPNTGGCPLPEKPKNGDYEVSDCIEGDFSSKCLKKPKTIVSQGVVLTYRCDPDYVLSENYHRSSCYDGIWDPQPPLCLKLCKGLSSNSLTLTCHYRGSIVDCGHPMRVGTELRAECKDTYKESDPSASFITTECLPDGTWAKELYRCVPDCGIKNTITPTLKGKALLNQSEYPWHADLFQIIGQNIVYLCGGTIIHLKAVLTAAMCAYDFSKNSKMDENTVVVAVGKSRKNWNYKETNEQKFRVREISIGDKFRGSSNSYEHDIAILELDRFIMFNAAAMPICFDRGERLSLYKGSNPNGTFVSWGTTETGGEKSDVLKVTRFQVLGYDSCRKKSQDSEFITYDKFCARSTKDSSVPNEDAGNGLAFPRFDYGVEQHFIYGILSIVENNSSNIGKFTNITEHMKWIDNVLNKVVISK